MPPAARHWSRSGFRTRRRKQSWVSPARHRTGQEPSCGTRPSAVYDAEGGIRATTCRYERITEAGTEVADRQWMIHWHMPRSFRRLCADASLDIAALVDDETGQPPRPPPPVSQPPCDVGDLHPQLANMRSGPAVDRAGRDQHACRFSWDKNVDDCLRDARLPTLEQEQVVSRPVSVGTTARKARSRYVGWVALVGYARVSTRDQHPEGDRRAGGRGGATRRSPTARQGRWPGGQRWTRRYLPCGQATRWW